jgi:hypothetical protein
VERGFRKVKQKLKDGIKEVKDKNLNKVEETKKMVKVIKVQLKKKSETREEDKVKKIISSKLNTIPEVKNPSKIDTSKEAVEVNKKVTTKIQEVLGNPITLVDKKVVEDKDIKEVTSSGNFILKDGKIIFKKDILRATGKARWLASKQETKEAVKIHKDFVDIIDQDLTPEIRKKAIKTLEKEIKEEANPTVKELQKKILKVAVKEISNKKNTTKLVGIMTQSFVVFIREVQLIWDLTKSTATLKIFKDKAKRKELINRILTLGKNIFDISLESGIEVAKILTSVLNMFDK